LLKNKESKEWGVIKEHFDSGAELRRPFDEVWLITLAFLGGRQYTFFNQTARILQQVGIPKGRIQAVDNRILPRYRKQISRLIRNRPTMSVVPNTDEQEDIEAAKIGDKFLKSFWRSAGMAKKMRLLAGWIYATGNGYLDDRWNTKKGPTQVKDGNLYYLGDVDCGVWSPFEIFVPAVGLVQPSLHDMPWLIKARYRPLGYFSSQWGKLGEQVMAEDVSSISPLVSGALPQSGSDLHSKLTEGALEIQLYIQPNDEYPKGCYLVGANGVVLNKQDYPFDSYNLEHFKDIELPGSYHGMATSQAAIWIQKLWNRTLSDIAEFNRTMGRGKWLEPAGANMQQAPDDTMGQRITYKPVMGLKPEQVTLKGLPASYQQILSLLMNSFMDLYYQHEVTQGTNKSDIRSGDMVQLLLDQDDFGNVPTHAVFEESLEAVMSRVLKRAQTGYTAERMVALTGKGTEFEVFSFKGADLRGNSDVFVKKESSLPDSRTGRQSMIMNRFEKGLYGNPQDPEIRRHVMNMLDDAVVEDIYGTEKKDEQLARIENKQLLQGKQFNVNIYDNHELHIKEHELVRKSYKFQQMKFAKDMNTVKTFMQLEMVFLAHVQQHQQILQAQIRQKMTQMAMAQGGVR